MLLPRGVAEREHRVKAWPGIIASALDEPDDGALGEDRLPEKGSSAVVGESADAKTEQR